MTDTTRRTVLAGAAGISAAVALAACGDGSNDTGSSNSAPTGNANAGAAGGSLGAATEIPVGGGKIFKDQKVVVTQPTAGQYKAFSTSCTHAGCDVTTVTTTINCPCHGSHFDLADGAPKAGPATKPLAAASVKVENGKLVMG